MSAKAKSYILNSFEALTKSHFEAEINAFCWHRELKGDFEEIVQKLNSGIGISIIEINDLLKLELSKAGQIARKRIIEDFNLLEVYGAAPVLNLINAYPTEDEDTFFSTDVYSFHVDSSPIASDTFLCTYYGACSEILPNEDAIQKISIPEIREGLKKMYNVEETDFADFANDNFFDLHYEAKIGAMPVNLGIGNLWRLAVKHPEVDVLPCIHRAPRENGAPRLLLIC
jgi:hypothetical protein